jgi:hypothetical protein
MTLKKRAEHVRKLKYDKYGKEVAGSATTELSRRATLRDENGKIKFILWQEGSIDAERLQQACVAAYGRFLRIRRKYTMFKPCGYYSAAYDKQNRTIYCRKNKQRRVTVRNFGKFNNEVANMVCEEIQRVCLL